MTPDVWLARNTQWQAGNAGIAASTERHPRWDLYRWTCTPCQLQGLKGVGEWCRGWITAARGAMRHNVKRHVSFEVERERATVAGVL